MKKLMLFGIVFLAITLMSSPVMAADYKDKADLVDKIAGGADITRTDVNELCSIEYQDGDDIILRKRPGRIKYTRSTSADGKERMELAIEKIAREALASDGNEEQDEYAIETYTRLALDAAHWNIYEAWPLKWEGPNFDSKGNGVNIKELNFLVSDTQFKDWIKTKFGGDAEGKDK